MTVSRAGSLKTVAGNMHCVACLVGNGLGVGSPLEGNSDGGRASSESRAGEAEGVHDGLSWWVRLFAWVSSSEAAGTNLCRSSNSRFG